MKQIFIFILLLSFIACKKEQVKTQSPTPLVTSDPYVGTWHEPWPQPNDGSPMQMIITKANVNYHINLSVGCGDTLSLTISSNKTLNIPSSNACGNNVSGGGAIVGDTLWLNWSNGSHSFNDKYIKL